jgi:hypothetical protein
VFKASLSYIARTFLKKKKKRQFIHSFKLLVVCCISDLGVPGREKPRLPRPCGGARDQPMCFFKLLGYIVTFTKVLTMYHS